jgi:predicted transcriptional regulator
MVTTTIRVSKSARDRLSALARQHSISASAQLDKLIEEAWWEAACRSERAAAAADRQNPAVAAEESLWDQTIADGLE